MTSARRSSAVATPVTSSWLPALRRARPCPAVPSSAPRPGVTSTPSLDALEVSGAHIGGPPLILGHRGAPREAPENTLASLRRALELGVDGVEYDVRACGSGEIVVFHDARLDRTTDGTGPIAGLDLRGLYGVDAGSWFGRRFEGEPIPVLDEVLALTPERRGSAPST